MKRALLLFSLSVPLLMVSGGVGCAGNLWGAVKSGDYVVLIRHAFAPGFGDPDNFDINECKTQRNLNDEGRLQSKRIGDVFRLNGIRNAIVYSSQWCRCLDTARLLELGKVTEFPALNSFFGNFEKGPLQTGEVLHWIKTAPLRTPTVLVSHQVNISALTGYSPASGEIIFVERKSNGSLSVVDSIKTSR